MPVCTSDTTIGANVLNRQDHVCQHTGSGQDVGGAARSGRLQRAWRRGALFSLLMVVATFSFFLMSSSQGSTYTRMTMTIFSHRSPEYIMDVMMPSNTSVPLSSHSPPKPSSASPSPPSSPSSPSPSHLTTDRSTQQDKKGFLVHSPGCVIPDFDPFHHTIAQFISKPKPINCPRPPAFTSAQGSTLFFHRDILHRYLPEIYKIYKEKHAAPTPTPRPKSKSKPKTKMKTTTTTTTTTTITTTSSKRNSIISLASLDRVTSTPASSTQEASVEAVKCCYKAIYRKEQEREKANGSADGRWRFSNWCSSLNTTTTEVKEDSALVICKIDGVVVYKNIHYFFHREKADGKSHSTALFPVAQQTSPHATGNTNNALNRTQGSTPRPSAQSHTVEHKGTRPSSGQQRIKDSEKLSVILIGTDSASRLNMLRNMPKTYDFLTKQLGALDFAGYNKVGDNTFPNLMPILGGYTQKEIDNHTCMTKSRHFDDCNWVWKDFKKNGYVTAYIEDAPWMGTFHYLRKGFIAKPTDYYGRPFFLASEKEIGGPSDSRGRSCQGPILSMEVIQNYSLNFARTFIDVPSFGYFWTASLTHNYLNQLYHADAPYLNYLTQLQETGALNHTALFFISDHGMRWGNIRSTYIGMLEERLPYVIIYLPPWFRGKYHTAFANAVANTRRLTANFDVHETLLDLAYGRFTDLRYVTSQPSRSERGISLFRNVHWDRTCSEAAIPPHLCSCQDTHQVDKHDPVLKRAAAFLKDFLNKLLKPHPDCEQFSKVEILSGRVSGSNKVLKPKESKSDVKSYLVQASLSRGGVVVEASIRYSPKQNDFQMLGEVSRISKYGATSGCIRDDLLRKYCYCKDQKKAAVLFGKYAKMQEGQGSK